MIFLAVIYIRNNPSIIITLPHLYDNIYRSLISQHALNNKHTHEESILLVPHCNQICKHLYGFLHCRWLQGMHMLIDFVKIIVSLHHPLEQAECC